MRSPPLRHKTTCEKHDLVQSGKSSLMSWPDVKLIPQTNNLIISSTRGGAGTTSADLPSCLAFLFSSLTALLNALQGARRGSSDPDHTMSMACWLYRHVRVLRICRIPRFLTFPGSFLRFVQIRGEFFFVYSGGGHPKKL